MIRINLLPREAVRRRAFAPRVVILLLIGVIFALVSVSTLYLNARNARIRAAIKAVDTQIEALRPAVARVEALRKEIEIARRKEQILRRLEALRIPWAIVLAEMRTVMPQDVWLVQVSAADDGGLIFSGFGLTYESVARFMVNLEASPMFEGIDLTIGQKQKIGAREVVNFTVLGRLSEARKEAGVR